MKGSALEGLVQSGGDAIQPAPMFSGVLTHNLDPKKRLNIPANWREQVGKPDRTFVMQGFDSEPCLYVFPMRIMAERLSFLKNAKVSDPRYRYFTRTLGESSAELTWDSQGRIRIPDNLLEYAGLTGAVFMLGAADRFELWHPDRRQSHKQEQEGKITIGHVAEELGF